MKMINTAVKNIQSFVISMIMFGAVIYGTVFGENPGAEGVLTIWGLLMIFGVIAVSVLVPVCTFAAMTQPDNRADLMVVLNGMVHRLKNMTWYNNLAQYSLYIQFLLLAFYGHIFLSLVLVAGIIVSFMVKHILPGIVDGMERDDARRDRLNNIIN